MFSNSAISIINRYLLLDDIKFCTFYHYIIDTVNVRLEDIGISEWYIDMIDNGMITKVNIHMSDMKANGIRIEYNSTTKNLSSLKELYSIKIELLELLTDIGYDYNINKNTLLSFTFKLIEPDNDYHYGKYLSLNI